MAIETKTQSIGYSFLLGETDPGEIFTPEDFSDEHRQFMRTTSEFLEQEVEPIRHDLEKLDRDLLKATLKKAGAAGLFMIEIPEEYGGLGLDMISQMVVLERMGGAGGFAVAYGVQTGIGSEPILFFGSEEQKRRYLPGLASGEIIGAYGLTEPGSGSDALAAKTTAVLSPDKKHYIINGSKVFISNGGIADLYTIFGKVDGELFTAFLIERDTPGFTIGTEEDKMGIKSSSTTTLTFQDVKVPVENVVGEIGKGHKIALNILNLGRLKLGIGVTGGMKQALRRSIAYGIQRKQFNTRLVDFPLIQQKLAKMTAYAYTSESVAYRTSGNISDILQHTSAAGTPTFQRQLEILEEFSGECAINKVFDSECLDTLVDESVQIHGGYGFCEEYKVEAGYRDARVSRIYEGTNEINRLFISGNVFKRALTGRLPLIQAVARIQAVVLSPIEPYDGGGKPLADVAEALFNAKRLYLFVGGVVAQKFMPDMERIGKEQEALAWMADIIMHIYALESAYLRAVKRIQAGDPRAEQYSDVVRYQMAESTEIIEESAKNLIDGYFIDDTRKTHLSIIRKFAKWPHVNRVEIGRRIARATSEAEGYLFEVSV
jgi:alkylation response protein AidB-like acyl-CoA dehydrogenase